MDSQKNKIPVFFIFSHPRSLSTILHRTLMNNPNIMARMEEFVAYYVSKNYKNTNYVRPSKEDFYKQIENKIEDAYKQNKTIIIKEHSGIMLTEYLEFFQKAVEKYDFKCLHLVRHPKPTYYSFWNQLDADKNATPDLVKETKGLSILELNWKFYQIVPGRVIITENLQENPPVIMKEIYEFIGLEFKEEYLKFKPLKEIGIPEDWARVNLNWYDTTINSTEIKRGKTDIDKIKITDEEMQKKIDSDMPYYELFKKERAKQLEK